MPIEKIAFEAVKVSVRQDKTGYILTLSIHPNDVPDGLLRCPVGTHFMVGMAEYEKAAHQAEQAEADLKIPPTIGRKLVQQAGILSRDPNFWKFAGVGDESNARGIICDGCGIDSRKALEYDPSAQERFKSLLEDFHTWMGKNA